MTRLREGIVPEFKLASVGLTTDYITLFFPTLRNCESPAPTEQIGFPSTEGPKTWFRGPKWMGKGAADIFSDIRGRETLDLGQKHEKGVKKACIWGH